MQNRPISPVLRYLRQLGAPVGADELPDAELLARFTAERDDTAFAALVRRHGPMVLGVCHRVLGDHHAAEDAFQATFLVLARKARGIARRELLGGWLHAVAYRTALRARPGTLRWTEIGPHVADLSAAEPLAELAWRELALALDEEVGRLPVHYRGPVVLCYLEGHSYTEAARRLGCPAGTVSGRLARARDLLRARLARRGLSLSAGVLTTLLGTRAAPAAGCPPLAESTIATATAGTVSAPVAALTEGVIKAMLWTRLKLTAAVLLVAGIVGTGGLVYQSRAQPPADGTDPFRAQPPVTVDRLEEKAERLRQELEELNRQLDRLRKAKQAELTAQQKQALDLIERGVTALKKSTPAGPRQKVVDDFDAAVKKLKADLQNPPLPKAPRLPDDRVRPLGPTPYPPPLSPSKPGEENPPRDRVEGRILSTDPDGTLVKLSVGSDSGLKRGHTLKAFRMTGQGQYLGVIEILSVTPDESVGRPVKRPLSPLKVGDRVASQILPGVR